MRQQLVEVLEDGLRSEPVDATMRRFWGVAERFVHAPPLAKGRVIRLEQWARRDEVLVRG